MSHTRLHFGAVLIALLLLGATAISLGAVIRVFEIHLTKLPIYPEGDIQFHTLPRELPSWKQARPDPETSSEAIDELGTRNFVSRLYAQKDVPAGELTHAIDLHCAYYTGMIDTVPHVPERCLVAGGLQRTATVPAVEIPLDFSRLIRDEYVDEQQYGTIWTARAQNQIRYRLPRGVENLRMRVSTFETETGQTFYAGYFFIANGGTVPSAEDVRLLAFHLNADYAYYAKVQFTSPTVSSVEEFAELVGSFLDEMFGEIARRVPDWIEVQEGRYPPDAIGGAGTSASAIAPFGRSMRSEEIHDLTASREQLAA